MTDTHLSRAGTPDMARLARRAALARAIGTTVE
jgi:hypothetical protein